MGNHEHDSEFPDTIRPLTSYEWSNKGPGEMGNHTVSMILNSQTQSDCSPTVNDSTRAQERWEIMSTILNSQPQSDHLQPMNDRTRAQERWVTMYSVWFWIPSHNQTTHNLWMIEQGPRTDEKSWAWFWIPQSDHLLPMNYGTWAQKR